MHAPGENRTSENCLAEACINVFYPLMSQIKSNHTWWLQQLGSYLNKVIQGIMNTLHYPTCQYTDSLEGYQADDLLSFETGCGLNLNPETSWVSGIHKILPVRSCLSHLICGVTNSFI